LSFPTAPEPRPSSRRISPRSNLAARRGRGICHGLLRADPRGLADAKRNLQRADLSPSLQFVCEGTDPGLGRLPNKGAVYRKIGRRKLVPYYDRAEIEDGKIEGRGLEIAYLKNQTDLLFAQIQGSARIELPDGSMVRINYDAHNGYPYTPVGAS
jgi:hypothetical protein